MIPGKQGVWRQFDFRMSAWLFLVLARPEPSRMPLSTNRFQLAVFGINVSHGCTISTAGHGIEVDWAESLRLARRADALGLEALIPVCRWKGFGGASEFNHRTTAVQSIHPVLAAKQSVTIDHIAGGRFGLNVVAGWNTHEVAMFGGTQLPHEERYAYTDEWMSLVSALWTRQGEFDFRGRHFDAPRCYAEPKPLQSPRPPVMSAGVSPAGRRFAAKHADMNFILAPNLDVARETVADVKRIARDEFGRDIEVWGNAAVFCRPTRAEAEDYYRYVIHERGDLVAAGNLLDTFTAESGSQLTDPALREAYLRNMMAGYSGFPVVGTPEDVVGFLSAMADCGMAGATLSWPDYAAGLDQLEADLLPLMEARGLRHAQGGARIIGGDS
jgi:alkanesulfonate monooxygenase SsuD/methylene tetrahydromethanopterin reductase-like flavin-dependent oxidoreductase (luciferase family)